MIQLKNIISNMFKVTVDNSIVMQRYYANETGLELVKKSDASEGMMDRFCNIYKFRYNPLEGITQTVDVKAHLECVDLCRDSKCFGWLTRRFPHKQWFLVVRFPQPLGCHQVTSIDFPLKHLMTLKDAYKSFVMEVNEKKFL